MDVRAYLDRIGYKGPLAATVATLRALHRQHMLTVPFENLDIGLGREIVRDPERFLEKIVRHHRGGFCYELNGAFATLLTAVGFRITLLSARVANEEGIASREFDHLTLRIDLEQSWLVDVGFGDNFLEPLRLISHIEQQDVVGSFRFVDDRERWGLECCRPDGSWRLQYDFSFRPRQLSEFASMCHYHQTSPRFPLHPQPCLLARHTQRSPNPIRHAPDQCFQRQEGRAAALDRSGLAFGTSRSLRYCPRLRGSKPAPGQANRGNGGYSTNLVFRATAEPSSGQTHASFAHSLFVRPRARILPMEKKLHVFVCQMFAHHSYPEFDQKLRELRAIPLMHSVWAARTVLTARELKDALRKTLDDSDRILVVEVSAGGPAGALKTT